MASRIERRSIVYDVDRHAALTRCADSLTRANDSLLSRANDSLVTLEWRNGSPRYWGVSPSTQTGIAAPYCHTRCHLGVLQLVVASMYFKQSRRCECDSNRGTNREWLERNHRSGQIACFHGVKSRLLTLSTGRGAYKNDRRDCHWQVFALGFSGIRLGLQWEN